MNDLSKEAPRAPRPPYYAKSGTELWCMRCDEPSTGERCQSCGQLLPGRHREDHEEYEAAAQADEWAKHIALAAGAAARRKNSPQK